MDYIEKIENGELFVKCINTVKDEEGTYLIAGKLYEVVDMDEDETCFIIECEQDESEMVCEIMMSIDDEDIEIVSSK